MSDSFLGPAGPGRYRPSEHDKRRNERIDNRQTVPNIRKNLYNKHLTKSDIEEAIETLEAMIRDMGPTRDFSEDDKQKFDQYVIRLRKLRGLLEDIEERNNPTSSHIEEDR
ncbi:MAG: hypothetical protein IKT41_02590 [Clostridia bacterium]|nr:hypothetical protein [Clostridia bacterium]